MQAAGGSRQAEVKNLRRNIRRQKVKVCSRKLAWKLSAKLSHIARRWMMILIQANHDVAILRTDDAGGAMHRVHRAVGQAEIVEDVVEFLARDFRRIDASIWSLKRAVSSIRVPVLART